MAVEPMNEDPLKLGNLPDLDPPEALWRSISDELDARTGGSTPPNRWLPIAAVAGLAALALSVTVLMSPFEGSETASGARGTLIRLQAVSAALERELEAYRGGVVSAATADSIARIEQELGWLDAQINETPADPALWAERIVLLDEMNQRYLQADWRNHLMLASY